MYLTKEQILAVNDRLYRDIEVPEWAVNGIGEKVLVRIAGLTAKAASDFSTKLVSLDDKGNVKELKMGNFLAELLSLTLVNPETFEPLFSQENVEALGKKSASVMKRLGDIAMELSGLNEKAVKDAEKN